MEFIDLKKEESLLRLLNTQTKFIFLGHLSTDSNISTLLGSMLYITKVFLDGIKVL
jgi:hypothetical protein